MKPVNDIFADIVKKVSKRYGSNVSFLFGDWAYISNQLTLWGKSPKTSKLKFPIICLYSPFTEDRSSAETEVSLEFIIMVNTLKGIQMKTGKRLPLSRYCDLYTIFSWMKSRKT